MLDGARERNKDFDDTKKTMRLNTLVEFLQNSYKTSYSIEICRNQILCSKQLHRKLFYSILFLYTSSIFPLFQKARVLFSVRHTQPTHFTHTTHGVVLPLDQGISIGFLESNKTYEKILAVFKKRLYQNYNLMNLLY